MLLAHSLSLLSKLAADESLGLGFRTLARRRIARASLAIAVCAVGAPLWLLMIWIRGGFRGFGKATTLVVSRCCSPSTKERSGDQRQRRAETLGRASSAGRKPPDLRAAAYMEVDQEVEDASEKVVTMALKASEGGERHETIVLIEQEARCQPRNTIQFYTIQFC